MNNQNIYRLIKPYQSNTVYEAKTLLHGAGKCYKELKKNNVNSSSFSIMNINDNSIYDFNINEKPKMELKKDLSELLNNNNKINQNGGNDEIKKDLDNIKNRLSIIENKLNIITNV